MCGSNCYSLAYAACIWFAFKVVQLIVGSYYIDYCNHFIPTGVYLIVSGALTVVVFITQQALISQKEYNKFEEHNKIRVIIAAHIYAIIESVWCILGLVTVWSSNYMCSDSEPYSRFVQACSIINFAIVFVFIYWTLNRRETILPC